MNNSNSTNNNRAKAEALKSAKNIASTIKPFLQPSNDKLLSTVFIQLIQETIYGAYLRGHIDCHKWYNSEEEFDRDQDADDEDEEQTQIPPAFLDM